jgi:hypothetical protein
MRKIFIIITLILINVIGYTQENVTLEQVDGVYIMALSSPVKGLKSTESIRVPNDVLEQSTSLKDRIHWVKTQSDMVVAVVTRDGINFQLIREWNNDAENEVLTSVLFSKPVFFLSEPQKKYEVIKQQKIEQSYFSMPYYEIAKSFVDLYPRMDYDALIVNGKMVQYIKF